MGKVVAAELIGTFWLVFGGCGSAVLAAAFPDVGIGLLGVSLAFGLTVLTMAYAIGHISGCHLNPAVSVGLVRRRTVPGGEVLPYVVAQVVGAVARRPASSTSSPAASRASRSPAGWPRTATPSIRPAATPWWRASSSEVVLTFMFLFIILGSTDDRAPKGFAPIAIGLGLTLIHLIGIPVTNLSVNPARSTGPALFVGGWALAQLWLFWVAPIVGRRARRARIWGGGRSGDGGRSQRATGARERRPLVQGTRRRGCRSCPGERVLDGSGPRSSKDAMLQDEGGGAQLERPLPEGLVVGRGDEDDFAEGQCLLDAAARLEAVDRRQVQVEHGHVGPQPHGGLHDREAVGDAADHVAIRGEQAAQRDQKRAVVLRQQDSRARLFPRRWAASFAVTRQRAARPYVRPPPTPDPPPTREVRILRRPDCPGKPTQPGLPRASPQFRVIRPACRVAANAGASAMAAWPEAPPARGPAPSSPVPAGSRCRPSRRRRGHVRSSSPGPARFRCHRRTSRRIPRRRRSRRVRGAPRRPPATRTGGARPPCAIPFRSASWAIRKKHTAMSLWTVGGTASALNTISTP